MKQNLGFEINTGFMQFFCTGKKYNQVFCKNNNKNNNNKEKTVKINSTGNI